MKAASRLLTPGAFLVAVTLLFSAYAVTAVLFTEEVSELTLWMWSCTYSLTLTCWVSSDRVGRAFHAPYDYEYFLAVAWPIVLPHYLYRTRGRKGLLLWVGVIALFFTPNAAAAIAYFLTRSSASAAGE